MCRRTGRERWRTSREVLTSARLDLRRPEQWVRILGHNPARVSLEAVPDPLHEEGMPLRNVGRVLGVSHQPEEPWNPRPRPLGSSVSSTLGPEGQPATTVTGASVASINTVGFLDRERIARVAN